MAASFFATGLLMARKSFSQSEIRDARTGLGFPSNAPSWLCERPVASRRFFSHFPGVNRASIFLLRSVFSNSMVPGLIHCPYLERTSDAILLGVPFLKRKEVKPAAGTWPSWPIRGILARRVRPDVVDFNDNAFFEVFPAGNILVTFPYVTMIKLLIPITAQRAVIFPFMRPSGAADR